MTSQANAAHDEVVIHINKTQFRIANPIVGQALRDLGTIPQDNQLFLESPGPEPDVLIIPTAAYTLKNGSHLYDLPRGTVGAVDRDEQLAFARQALDGATVASQTDGSALLQWPTEATEGWDQSELVFAVVVPPMFPAQAPSGFDILGRLTRAGAQPAGSGPRLLGDADATHFCWNPAGAIDYAAPDGLWRFAKFAETRLREGQ
jgi:hypothetical protein